LSSIKIAVFFIQVEKLLLPGNKCTLL